MLEVVGSPPCCFFSPPPPLLLLRAALNRHTLSSATPDHRHPTAVVGMQPRVEGWRNGRAAMVGEEERWGLGRSGWTGIGE